MIHSMLCSYSCLMQDFSWSTVCDFCQLQINLVFIFNLCRVFCLQFAVIFWNVCLKKFISGILV